MKSIHIKIVGGLFLLSTMAFASKTKPTPAIKPTPAKKTATQKKADQQKYDFVKASETVQADYDKLRKQEKELSAFQYKLQMYQMQGNKAAFDKEIETYKTKYKALIGASQSHGEMIRGVLKDMKHAYSKSKVSAEELRIYAGLLERVQEFEQLARVMESLEGMGKFELKDYESFAKTYNQRNLLAKGASVLDRGIAYAKKKNLDSNGLKLTLAKNHFWLENFDKAEAMLKELAKQPSYSQQSLKLKKAVVDTRNKYKKELEYRKKEKNLPTATISTSKGQVDLVLYEDDAPNGVANFITLAESKYYDGQTFHRVIPNFMAQGGDINSKDKDPSNDGKGGPGYKIMTDLSKRFHFRGVISYANAGLNTDGSQFFLTTIPTFWLDGKHAVFGRITKGQHVVDSITKGDKINSIKITHKRKHPYVVKKIGAK